MGLTRGRKRQRPLDRFTWGKEPEPQEECRIVRRGAGGILDFSEGCLHLQDLSCGANAKGFGAVIATAEPGASCWEAVKDAGQKWYYILEGQLEVLVNEISYLLEEGDAIYLKSSASHVWRNPGKRRTKALVLSSAP